LSLATGGIESACCEVENKWPDNIVRIGIFCMRRTIETAPRDGNAIILEDDASGTYDVAHWSAETGEWVGENGKPGKIKPTHWYSLQGDNFLQQGHDISSSPSLARPSASRAHRYSFFFPFSLRRAPPQWSAASDVIASRSVPVAAPMTVEAFKAQTAPVEANPAPHARRGFAASSIAATLIAAALIGVYFRAEVAAYVTRHAGQQDIVGVSTIGEQIVEQTIGLLSQDLRKIYALALQQRTEVDQAGAQAGAQLKQAVEASASPRPEVLANELAEARRAIDGLNLQLQAEATKTAQLLGQEREKTAALAQEATAAQQELTASTVQHRHALEEERARSAALTSELAIARREIETQVTLLRKAGDEAVQLKQATERSMAELRQSLQQERDRVEAPAQGLESTRHPIGVRIALERAANSPINQVKQAAEAAAAEQPAAAEAQGGPEAARLLARANGLLGQGNIGAARIVLERAAETGSAQASFMLAETYDPVILSTWETYGTRGDAAKARELYAKAHVGGVQEAKDRFNALGQ
jgi:hypothetical protein